MIALETQPMSSHTERGPFPSHCASEQYGQNFDVGVSTQQTQVSDISPPKDVNFVSVKVSRVSFAPTKRRTTPVQRNDSTVESIRQTASRLETHVPHLQNDSNQACLSSMEPESRGQNLPDRKCRTGGRSWIRTKSEEQSITAHPVRETKNSTPTTDTTSQSSGLLTLSEMGVDQHVSVEPVQTPRPNNRRRRFNNIVISDDSRTVTGFYFTDLNILQIHAMIIRKFEDKKTDHVIGLERRLEAEIEKMARPQTGIERKDSVRIVKSLDGELSDINEKSDLKEYLKRSDELITAYQEIGPKPDIISFKSSASKTETDDSSDEQMKRFLIIERYLTIARKYVDVDVVKINDLGGRCRVCNGDLEGIVNEENGLLLCPHCKIEFTILAKSYSYDDEPTTPTNHQSNYEDRENFWKALQRYQGKQPNKLPSNLSETLDIYFSSLRLPSGKEVEALPLNPDGSRGKTTRDLMYKALHDVNMAQYYEDVNLICHIYWGWHLPDVSHLEEAIMTDYDVSQVVFEQHKGTRKSCLNTQYRLWRHLSRLKHSCKPRDFKIVKTPEIVEFHEQMWITICRVLGWNSPEPLVL